MVNVFLHLRSECKFWVCSLGKEAYQVSHAHLRGLIHMLDSYSESRVLTTARQNNNITLFDRSLGLTTIAVQLLYVCTGIFLYRGSLTLILCIPYNKIFT